MKGTIYPDIFVIKKTCRLPVSMLLNDIKSSTDGHLMSRGICVECIPCAERVDTPFRLGNLPLGHASQKNIFLAVEYMSAI